MNTRGRAILDIYRSAQTVFTVGDLALLWRTTDPTVLKNRINYYTRVGQLIRLRRGVYAKDKSYDKYELGVKIFSPSYISLETVLIKHGVIFQYYESIFIASRLSREISVAGQNYTYRKLKPEILTSPAGVENRGYYHEASLERAFMDYIYLFRNIHLDNLSPIDWDKCRQLSGVYANKALMVRIEKYARQE